MIIADTVIVEPVESTLAFSTVRFTATALGADGVLDAVGDGTGEALALGEADGVTLDESVGEGIGALGFEQAASPKAKTPALTTRTARLLLDEGKEMNSNICCLYR